MKSKCRSKSSEGGLTLIELLAVIAIVGIIAAVAIPSYRNHLIRARRADAKVALEQIRAAQEMWRAERGTYAVDAGGNTAETILINTMGVPSTTINNFYTWSFTTKTTTAFTAQATPQGAQASDGALTIDQNGTKLPADKWSR
ncbi:MAG: prepilin-type N-terminal cleavage/methylation domain-containing protein [Syntrophaceae bacterium]|nr:prepilin-type N-terminal cleavage/methylation domain-containing protein [Syntrophaceae bacterium]